MRKSKSWGEGFVLSPSSACETTILYHMIIFLLMEEVGEGNEIKGLSFFDTFMDVSDISHLNQC